MTPKMLVDVIIGLVGLGVGIGLGVAYHPFFSEYYKLGKKHYTNIKKDLEKKNV